MFSFPIVYAEILKRQSSAVRKVASDGPGSCMTLGLCFFKYSIVLPLEFLHEYRARNKILYPFVNEYVLLCVSQIDIDRDMNIDI